MQQTLEIQQLLPKEGMRSTRDARLRTTGLEESIPPLESHSIGLHHETVDNHVLAVNLEKRISDECHFISVFKLQNGLPCLIMSNGSFSNDLDRFSKL